MNTFISKNLDGNKVAFLEDKHLMGNLNPDYSAKYCTCTQDTQNVSEIPDWDTAENVAYVVE